MSKKEKIDELLKEALIPKDEQPYEVPENWVWLRLGAVADFLNGIAFKPSQWTDSGLPIIRIQNLNSKNPNYRNFNYYQGDYDEKYLVKNGDLLFAWSGNIGTSFGSRIYEGETGILNQHIYKVFINELVLKMYFHFCIQSRIDDIHKNAHGGAGLTHITKKKLETLPFPLPSINEQVRIAEKVKHLLGKVEEAKQLIEEAKETSELRRSAILDKAFSGELTRKWRKEISTEQTFDELLEKIRIEKENIYLGLLDKAKKEGSKKPARQKKYDNKFNQEDAISLPNNWGYCTLGDVIYDFKYGTSEKSDYDFKGTPVIRIPNIEEEFIDTDDLKYLKENIIDFSSSVLEGDILIVRSNGSRDLVGKCSIVQKSEEKYAFASYLIRLRPVLVVPEFILWLLKSDRVKEQFFSKSKSSAGINNINTEELATTIIPLPPVEEQKEIVKKLKVLLAKEEVTKKILDLDDYVGALKQSILSQAFRGELGTNDPSEESAIELLKEVLKEQMK
ncbi:restriction endonuclease subunit S [Bacillus sp. UNC438CL73TsuS30]|uniref:restriction endonuclease subunit S n=1 Tax=Bacillus sp. UNC438CL73TsuS30 TaxID=1340434 RepID=UPI00047CE47D|nr:restriction endonuclease subunit S [Bacillus sp. UNC438CL73TsuS30]